MSRLRIVTVPEASRSGEGRWRAYCPELPDIPGQYGATETLAKSRLETVMLQRFNSELHMAITQLERAFNLINVSAPDRFTWENPASRRDARFALRKAAGLHERPTLYTTPAQHQFVFLGEYLFNTETEE